MKALLQRVGSATVEIEGRVAGKIGSGLLVFLCVMKGDTESDLDYIMRKVTSLRVFSDAQGKMNLSVLDRRGELLVVAQFTLAASVRKGNRPSFDSAQEPVKAKEMYEAFIHKLRETGLVVQTGEFAATMTVSLTNEGPVTILVDSRNDTI